MKCPNDFCFQSVATPRNLLKTRKAPPFRRGRFFFPRKIDPPRAIPGGTFLFFSWKSIYPGGNTPCECFQAEKVMGGGRKPLGGGNPRLLRYMCAIGKLSLAKETEIPGLPSIVWCHWR